MDGPSKRPTPSAPGRDRLRYAVILLLLVVFVSLVLLRGSVLLWRHDQTVADAQRRAESLAGVLSEHLEQTIRTADAALAQLVLHNDRMGGHGAPVAAWDPVLQAALAGLAGVGSISVTDRDGRITHSTMPEIVGQSRANQYLFRYFASVRSHDLAADTPIRSVRDGRMLIPVGRRLHRSDGGFDGVVVATVDPQRLGSFYRSIDVGPNGAIWVLHPAGLVLLREPADDDRAGETAGENPLFTATRNEFGHGFFRGPLARGSEPYLSAFRTVAKPHLLLAVSLSEADVLADWRRERAISIAGGIAIGLLLLIAGVLINREIRARTEADEALERSEAQTRQILENAPMFVAVKGRDERYRFVNQAFQAHHKTAAEQAVGRTAGEVVPPDLAAVIADLDRKVLATERPVQHEVTTFEAGERRTYLFVKFPLFDGAGAVDAVVTFGTEVTEQRRAQAWFDTIMENAPSAVVVKDVAGRYLYANRAVEEWLGIGRRELLGRTTDELFPPEYATLHGSTDQEVIEHRRAVQREFLAPFSYGQRRLLFVKFPILDNAGNVEAIGSIATDITERRQVEAQLAQAQKMEAVGLLTGGIAHDFNNMLTVIIGNAEVLADSLAGNERLRAIAQGTLEAAERSAALTQRLLAFGRRQMLEPRPIDVNRLVRGMEELILRSLDTQFRVAFKCDESVWPATVDPEQLESAILNLVVNSRDAMPDGGEIAIYTENVQIDEEFAKFDLESKPGDYVMIAVADTGTGMPPEVVARAFEPFFTTKEVGKGTGLGLPTIYGFVKQSGGHMKIYSEVGRGTVVRLYFPRADGPSVAPSLPARAPEKLPGGTETILLVEDDPYVRAHAQRQLAELGYQVVTAGDGAEALRKVSERGKPDLLLTDMVMPGGMNGRELAKRLRVNWPDLRVLYASGYPGDTIAAPMDNGDGTFLPKPFRRRDLALKVREALDARHTEPAAGTARG